MNCKNVQSMLSAYIDDELGGQEMLVVREHVVMCHACADELQAVEGVKRLLSNSPIPEPSAGFENRLVKSVLAATKTPAEQRRLSLLALTGIAAASMLATLLFLSSTRGSQASVSEHTDSVP